MCGSRVTEKVLFNAVYMVYIVRNLDKLVQVCIRYSFGRDDPNLSDARSNQCLKEK